jgi:hypothetical protein
MSYSRGRLISVDLLALINLDHHGADLKWSVQEVKKMLGLNAI